MAVGRLAHMTAGTPKTFGFRLLRIVSRLISIPAV